jgi:hypothetical protein
MPLIYEELRRVKQTAGYLPLDATKPIIWNWSFWDFFTLFRATPAFEPRLDLGQIPNDTPRR